jgi:hypothetical protein
MTMVLKNVFEEQTVRELAARVNKLTADKKPLWGKMNAAQMLAHLNVMYEMVYENKYPKPGPFKRFIISLLAKKMVVGDKPYPRNIRTAPAFLIRNERNFENEKQRLIGYIGRTKNDGEKFFDGRESHSFGPLTIKEWNTMFYKHLDHHLSQFGV